MMITDLDGNTVRWNPIGVTSSLHLTTGSKLHQEARLLLKEVFPTIFVLEEVTIPVTRYKKLFLDFYIPLLRVAVEVQGQQHTSFSSLFHKNKWDLFKQKDNDDMKNEWCFRNDINLLYLDYKEKIDEWKQKLEQWNADY